MEVWPLVGQVEEEVLVMQAHDDGGDDDDGVDDDDVDDDGDDETTDDAPEDRFQKRDVPLE